jgi:chromatin segregation and condensation protein Rec8/ScpA/Scc1 (kleisin family)
MAPPPESGKPFFYMPPWNLLFELHKLSNLRPWEINISFLLSTFLEEMEKRGEIDFRASGVALDSSSAIYLMKARLLLKLEEPPTPPKVSSDFLPPPLFLPVRYELTSTTVQELLKVLDLIEIDRQMRRLYNTLLKHANEAKLVVFSKIIETLDRLEAIKTFIVLLFLAQKGDVSLWQDENLKEIYITISTGSANTKPAVGII